METGGVGRATRTLVKALSDLYGEDEVGVLAVWRREAMHTLPARWVHPGWAGSGRVPVRVQIEYAVRAVSAARRRKRQLVVIAAHPHLAPVARLAAVAAGCRYAVWTYGYEVWGPVRRRVRAGLAGADAVWALSEFTATQLRNHKLVASERVRILCPTGPRELTVKSAQPAVGQPLVLAVGALKQTTRYKGIDTLLHAWPTVLRQIPDACLRIVGDGDERYGLERICSALNLDDGNVRFCGRVSDTELAAAYAQATVFALPARARVGAHPEGEGFGLVYLEAAAAGLPVVAGKAGGAVEAVEEGRTGLLVDPEDPRAVAEALIELLGDRDRARDMGRAGREFVEERFSYDRFRNDVKCLVSELLGLVSERLGVN